MLRLAFQSLVALLRPFSDCGRSSHYRSRSLLLHATLFFIKTIKGYTCSSRNSAVHLRDWAKKKTSTVAWVFELRDARRAITGLSGRSDSTMWLPYLNGKTLRLRCKKLRNWNKLSMKLMSLRAWISCFVNFSLLSFKHGEKSGASVMETGRTSSYEWPFAAAFLAFSSAWAKRDRLSLRVSVCISGKSKIRIQSRGWWIALGRMLDVTWFTYWSTDERAQQL